MGDDLLADLSQHPLLLVSQPVAVVLADVVDEVVDVVGVRINFGIERLSVLDTRHQKLRDGPHEPSNLIRVTRPGSRDVLPGCRHHSF